MADTAQAMVVGGSSAVDPTHQLPVTAPADVKAEDPGPAVLPATEATEPPNGAAQPSAAGSKRPADGNTGAAPSGDAKGKVRKRSRSHCRLTAVYCKLQLLFSLVVHGQIPQHDGGCLS